MFALWIFSSPPPPSPTLCSPNPTPRPHTHTHLPARGQIDLAFWTCFVLGDGVDGAVTAEATLANTLLQDEQLDRRLVQSLVYSAVLHSATRRRRVPPSSFLLFSCPLVLPSSLSWLLSDLFSDLFTPVYLLLSSDPLPDVPVIPRPYFQRIVRARTGLVTHKQIQLLQPLNDWSAPHRLPTDQHHYFTYVFTKKRSKGKGRYGRERERDRQTDRQTKTERTSAEKNPQKFSDRYIFFNLRFNHVQNIDGQFCYEYKSKLILCVSLPPSPPPLRENKQCYLLSCVRLCKICFTSIQIYFGLRHC